MFRPIILFLTLWVYVSIPVFGSISDDGAAKCVMDAYGRRLLAGEFEVSEVFGTLYIKERVDVRRQMIYLNLIPGLTRFNSKKQDYLSEFFYDVHYVKNSVPDIRRVAHLTTFRHGSGEIDRVLFYMSPDFLREKLFKAQYLSPIHPANYRYYTYSVDTAYAGDSGEVKVCFKKRFDNIKLLTEGWVVLDSVASVLSFYAEGWDEQSRFKVNCEMGRAGLERYVVKKIDLEIDYKFALNKLDIRAEAEYDYSALSNELKGYDKKERFDLTGSLNAVWDTGHSGGGSEYASLYRKKPLLQSDSLMYVREGVMKCDTASVLSLLIDEKNSEKKSWKNDKVLRWLWEAGDKMVSSHYLNWGSSDLKLYPLINPSYLRYSTGKGVTYKLAMNFNSRLGNGNYLFLKPWVGYSFKRKEVYWGVQGNWVFDVRNRGTLLFSLYRDNSIYQEFSTDDENAEKVVAPETPFKRYNVFRDTRMNIAVQRELCNGLDVRAGVNFYYRTMREGKSNTAQIKHEKFRSLAPSLLLTWHPGMYYYYDGNRKVNLGSRMPRFLLDVEQGVRGIFASKDVYTRVEFDMQHKKHLQGNALLYTRLGFGGYVYEKNSHFISYTFLCDNILPLDKDDELSGVFHLLDSRWYNSANRYLRANAAYVSPFLVLQKVLPRVKFFKNEMLFFNLLFISDLCPYFELGYGVETPYVNLGVFTGFENFSYHKIGFKITVSLFDD